MTVHARPEPTGELAQMTHAELLVTVQRQHDQHAELVRELHKLIEAMRSPAQLRGPYRLSSAVGGKQTDRDDAGRESPSFGVFNPNPVKVYLGMGSIARPGSAGLSVPANSLVVFPLSITDLDIGIDPADPLTAQDAIVTVLRFETVQPAFLGAL